MEANSSLDPRPTTVENLARDDAEQGYIHERWATERERWKHVLSSNPGKPGHLERLQTCGRNAWVQRSVGTGRLRVVSDSCKLRICPRCQHIAANRIRRRLTTALTSRTPQSWRLITLTQRSTSAPLRIQIANLKAAFRRLRQRAFWKAHVIGGYAVLEITINEKTHLWHPHLHIVAEGKFIPQAELSKEWCTASRGSKIVDVRVIKDTEKAIDYVARYVTKVPEQLHSHPPEKAFELYQAMQGNRYLIAFGEVPKPQDPEPDPTEPQDWEPFTKLSDLLADASRGVPWARMILSALRSKDQDHGNVEVPPSPA